MCAVRLKVVLKLEVVLKRSLSHALCMAAAPRHAAPLSRTWTGTYPIVQV